MDHDGSHQHHRRPRIQPPYWHIAQNWLHRHTRRKWPTSNGSYARYGEEGAADVPGSTLLSSIDEERMHVVDEHIIPRYTVLVVDTNILLPSLTMVALLSYLSNLTCLPALGSYFIS